MPRLSVEEIQARCPAHVKVLDWRGTKTKSLLYCTKHKVEYEGYVTSHGCPQCTKEGFTAAKNATFLKKLDDYLKRFKYDVKLVGPYTRDRKATTFECKKHGRFQAKPCMVIGRLHPCKECTKESQALTFKEWKAKFVQTPNQNLKLLGVAGGYDSRHISPRTKIKWVCKKHCTEGVALAATLENPNALVCQKCWNETRYQSVENISAALLPCNLQAEREVEQFVKSLAGDQCRVQIVYKALQTQVPPLHARDQYDLALINGRRMLSVYEDDWRYRRHAVEHLIRNALGANTEKWMARKLSVKTTTKRKQVAKFFDKYHIQGAPQSVGIAYGLFDGKRCVACMVFDRVRSRRGVKQDSSQWELVRFAAAGSVVGGASKLFSAFLKEHQPEFCVSYSANDWFSGEMYHQTLGFRFDGDVRPDYWSILKNRRRHKSNTCRSRLQVLLGKKFDPNLSERQNCEANNIWRIYDAGKKRWVWNRALH